MLQDVLFINGDNKYHFGGMGGIIHILLIVGANLRINRIM